jgi:RimJ/RimL family protein N-acetyltransferase
MEQLVFRKAIFSDSECYYNWLNDSAVRKQSFNSDLITWEQHNNWFQEKINDPNYSFYLFQTDNRNLIGQVRLQQIDNINSIIGVSVSNDYRGLGYGSKILKMACIDYLKNHPNFIINAYIKADNISSKSIFEKSGFIFIESLIYNNFNSSLYKYYAVR